MSVRAPVASVADCASQDGSTCDGSVVSNCYTLSSALPDWSSQLGQIKRAPLHAARSNNIRLGDARLKCTSSLQQDSLDAIVQAALKEGYTSGARRLPQAGQTTTRKTSLCLGTDTSDWTTTTQSFMLDWYSPATYECA
eukprot:TRINITY_DN25572_c0_g1_i1.p1 TRINITY_DN25572_c0_g1~~TRINITY_DN25572_c0_g1_i1.p1  ORF type:complete len:146 (+),score=26.27 TRINITY_DN25572_c0_g1_i1:24-440(+)